MENDIYEFQILSDLADNSDTELVYFQKAYLDNVDNQLFLNRLYHYFSCYVKGDFNTDHTYIFLLNLYNKQVINEFLEEWQKYIKTNNTLDEKYEILKKLLQSSKQAASTICQQHKISERDSVNAIKCNILKYIWDMPSLRESVGCFPKLETGMDYLTQGILAPFFTPEEWYENVDLVIDTCDGLINDVSVHPQLLIQIWNMLDVNSAFTVNNFEIINKKKCSPFYYTIILMKIVFKMIDTYGNDKMIDEIMTNETIYTVSEYNIENLPYSHQLFITITYAITIAHLSTFRIAQRLTSEMQTVNSHPHSFISYGHATKQQLAMKYARVIKLMMFNIESVQNIYVSYATICKKIKMEKLFDDILTYLDYVFTTTNKEYTIKNPKMYVMLSDIMGGLDKNITNKHIRQYATDLILKVYQKYGYGVFGNIFDNLFKYLCEVDFFQWSMITRAISHHNRIQQLLIMILDSHVDIAKIKLDNDKNIAGTLFNLVKRGFDMYSHFNSIVSSIQASVYFPNASGILNMPTDMKNLCSDFMSGVLYTILVAKLIYNQKLITDKHPELNQMLSLLLINNIEKLSVGYHPLYTTVKNPKLAGTILSVTYEFLGTHLSDDMMPYFGDHKDMILSIMKNIKLSSVAKTNITTIFANYVPPEEIDWPQEFLDPISCCVVETPVMLPKIPTIHDKTTILIHIKHDPINPYTKEDLTEEILIEYNQKPEIKAQLDNFLERKTKWLSEHKSI